MYAVARARVRSSDPCSDPVVKKEAAVECCVGGSLARCCCTTTYYRYLVCSLRAVHFYKQLRRATSRMAGHARGQAPAGVASRRLRHVAAHLLVPPGGDPYCRSRPTAPTPAAGEGVAVGLLPLAVGRGFTPDLAALESAIGDAAASADFRQAAALQDLHFVAAPKPTLGVGDCAPESASDAADFFLQNGFVAIRELFAPSVLARLQAAWGRAQAPARALWDEARAMGRGARGLYFENQEEVNQMLAAKRGSGWELPWAVLPICCHPPFVS